MPILTIFTPTYNRAALLERCYRSLCAQTSSDFCWLIVDDGSIDDTAQRIARWQSAPHRFEIRAITKENGGLHTAYNAAIAAITTELSVCIDSDDYLPPDAVEKILRCWAERGSDRVAGIVGLDCRPDGSILGDKLPNRDTVNLIDLLTGKYRLRNGDRTNVVRTELYRKFAPMPVFAGEKNFNPHYLHLQISRAYDFLVLNEVLRVAEYRADGMTRRIFCQYLDSPRSFAETRKLYLSFSDAPLLFRLRHAAHLVSSGILSHDLHRTLRESPRPLETALMLPLGLLLTFYIRYRAKRTPSADKTHLLFVIHDLGQGGAEKVLVELVNSLDASRFDITLLALFGGGENEAFLKPHIRLKHALPRPFPANSHLMKLFSPKFLHKLLIRAHYDVEISYLEGPSARIVSGCPDPDTKKLCWIHVAQGSKSCAAASFRSYREALDAYSRFDRIVCVSDAVKDDFLSLLPVAVPTQVLYNPIDCAKIRALAQESVPDALFLPSELAICAVGKLRANKGFARIIPMITRLRAKGIPVHLYLLGDGPERAALSRLAGAEAVTFLGYQTNPYKFLARCDIFISASRSEGFSTATAEALTLGVPVCAADAAGMNELLGESEYGIVAENDDALYAALYSLASDAALRAHYRRQALLRAEKFDKIQAVRAVEALLRTLTEDFPC